jgi:SepF-like predicted cell division protein (DUF552 family)
MEHSTTYVKAFPLRELDDVEMIKLEIRAGNIVIVRITSLARKSVEETKLAITELTDHVKSLGGDIARLGEERIVITPRGVRIWRRENMMITEQSGSSSAVVPSTNDEKTVLSPAAALAEP